ncbi:MAG: ATP-binding protein [Lachnospiraceae bacterium]|nr:ATP-binding protein [Lachnospiraceae bacterium]
MFVGRKKECRFLEDNFKKEGSNLLVLYGHKGVGKTSLVFHFARKLSMHYYAARPCAEEEQILLWNREIKAAGGGLGTDAEYGGDGFDSIFGRIYDMSGDNEGKKLIVIDEFQNIIKYSETFMVSLLRFIKEAKGPVMVLLLSSSISFVENDFVPRIGSLALGISGFFKVPELGFIDIVNYFSGKTTKECMEIYSILGGLPLYWSHFDKNADLKENLIRNVLSPSCFLREEGGRLVSAELRELNVYCTILSCMANGENKLNDLHIHTGYSRAKISVYIKNLMERELVEKVFPFDNASNTNAKKGLYRVSLRFLQFWFRFIFGNLSALESMDPYDFYEKYVEPGIAAFHQENFRKVCSEYLDILNENGMLPIKATKSGEWVGKEGSIDIVMQDEEWESLLAFCSWDKEEVDTDDLDSYLKIIENARLHPDYVYVFAAGRFSEGLKKLAEENRNVRLVDIDTL